jgi:cyclophilin family peptidyl-prolyl cis-trans isomerase
MRSRLLIIVLALVALIAAGLFYSRKISVMSVINSASVSPSPSASQAPSPFPSQQASALPSASPSPAVSAAPSSNPAPDLTTDTNGFSKATVVMTTSAGVVKFKLLPKDAPATVGRIVELVTKVESPVTHQPGFYNGLIFHRVVPGFIVQGGDPKGDGTGGSGVRLKPEFTNRRHAEGTIAMAHTPTDPNSGDSQFYISMGTFPHLDGTDTIFGQVIEGMDVVKKLKVGDKIVTMVIE